jgi:signal transduction histidine kinase
MKMPKQIQLLINYCANALDNPSVEDLRRIKAFILVWTSTTVIMWFYVAFSYWVYDFPLVGTLGILYTIIHTLAPVIYRYTRSLTLAGFTISLTALCFQVTFCIYNGGIHSPSAIWFTAHPVIISFFASKGLILISVFLNMLVVLGLTMLGNMGYFPANALDGTFTEYMTISSLIFLDIIIATYTIVFIYTTEENAKELQERNDLIENLMRIIGHDISNALNVSELSTKTLKRYIDDERAIKKIELINKSNKQISEISHSVLHWMKSQDSDFKLKSERLTLNELIEYIDDSFKTALEQKNISIEIQNSLPDGAAIRVDSSAFKYQVVTNLLTNAIKFSPFNSKITVVFEEHKGKLKLSVIDNGIGIPTTILKTIFDPCRSSSRKGTDGESGTGFGMPIVKNLVEGMKGTIKIVSVEKTETTLKSGTRISVRVPLCLEQVSNTEY